MDFKAAIFDFDATLVDSMPVWREEFLKWANKFNVEIDDELLQRMMFQTFEENLEYAKKHVKGSVNYAVLSLCLTMLYKYLFEIKAVNYAKEYLKTLKEHNIKTALATNCPPLLCKITLKKQGMYDYFDTFLFSRDIRKGKDEPDIFLKAAELLNVECAKCMVFDDSPNAFIGAKKSRDGFYCSLYR